MKCPVCENEYDQGVICSECSFDLSRHYERLPTLSMVNTKAATTVDSFRKKMKIIDFKLLHCPQCKGTAFSVFEDKSTYICLVCGNRTESFLKQNYQFEKAESAARIPAEAEKPVTDLWRCSCGYKNLWITDYCLNCGRMKLTDIKDKRQADIFHPSVSSNVWICSCGNKNNLAMDYCVSCGKEKSR